MNKIKLVGNPMPESCLRHIGTINANFSLLENTISSLIGILLNPKDQFLGQLVTAELSYKNVLNLLGSLAIHRNLNSEQKKELKELISLSFGIEQKRNRVVHSIWLSGNDSDSVCRSKTTARHEKGLKKDFENMSSEDLKRVTLEILELNEKYFNFMFQLVEAEN